MLPYALVREQHQLQQLQQLQQNLYLSGMPIIPNYLVPMDINRGYPSILGPNALIANLNNQSFVNSSSHAINPEVPMFRRIAPKPPISKNHPFSPLDGNNFNQNENENLLNLANKNKNNDLPTPKKIIKKMRLVKNSFKKEGDSNYAEDMQVLIKHAQAAKFNWKTVSQRMVKAGYRYKTPSAWRKILKNYTKLKRLENKVYSKQEIEDVRKYVSEYGKNWDIVAKLTNITPDRAKNIYYSKIYKKNDKSKALIEEGRKTRSMFFKAPDLQKQPVPLVVPDKLTELKILNESDASVLKL